jgi:hypothetical protein
MAREDIKTCVKNALERNENPMSIKSSLLNAGYPRQDIEDAMQEVKGIEIKLKEAPKPKFLPQLPKPVKK